MPGELLLDAGGLVSLLDRSQRFHGPCLEVFDGWTGPVLSTEAVLTEATHLLARVTGGRRACLDFFLSGAAMLVPSTLASLRRCRALLEKDADLPMDFADASLVVLAEEIGTNTILTTDRRDFTVYRIGGRRRFRVLPSAG
jgi:predicted nucleic acid-binding protein